MTTIETMGNVIKLKDYLNNLTQEQIMTIENNSNIDQWLMEVETLLKELE